MLVLTRHSRDFDIFTAHIDPTKSRYAQIQEFQYVDRIKAFYSDLGIESVIWAIPKEQPFKYFEPEKPVEYEVEVSDDRIVAYVDELAWRDHLHGRSNTFVAYSTAPRMYEQTSILIAPPLTRSEVRIRRILRQTNGPSSVEIIYESSVWPGE